jgi:hypothetical protein
VDELFPEMLAGAALAARFAAEEGVWEQFITWCRDNGILLDGEVMSRALMLRSSRVISEVRKQIEIELLAARISESLDHM